MGCPWTLTLHFWWEIEHRRSMLKFICVVMAGYKKEVILFNCNWHIIRQQEKYKSFGCAVLCCVVLCWRMLRSVPRQPACRNMVYLCHLQSEMTGRSILCLSCFNSYCSNTQARNPYVYFSMWYMSPKRRWIGISPIVSLKKSCSTVACRTALRLGMSNKRRPNRVGWRG